MLMGWSRNKRTQEEHHQQQQQQQQEEEQLRRATTSSTTHRTSMANQQLQRLQQLQLLQQQNNTINNNKILRREQYRPHQFLFQQQFQQQHQQDILARTRTSFSTAAVVVPPPSSSAPFILPPPFQDDDFFVVLRREKLLLSQAPVPPPPPAAAPARPRAASPPLRPPLVQAAAVASTRRWCDASSLFPFKLYHMLKDCSTTSSSDEQKADVVVSWLPDGKAFQIHNRKVFAETFLPKYFKLRKYRSFQKQLNLWDFDRTRKDAYVRKHFTRDEPLDCEKLHRVRFHAKKQEQERRRLVLATAVQQQRRQEEQEGEDAQQQQQQQYAEEEEERQQQQLDDDDDHHQQQHRLLFPVILHKMLKDCSREKGVVDGRLVESVISWLPNGKAFKIHNRKVFAETFLPKYFKLRKYRSFQKQLNLWDFYRTGKDAYVRKHFTRDEPLDCEKLHRVRFHTKTQEQERRRLVLATAVQQQRRQEEQEGEDTQQQQQQQYAEEEEERQQQQLDDDDDHHQQQHRLLFPVILHKMLKDCSREKGVVDGRLVESVISWLPNGKAFKIHNRKVFAETFLPKYFSRTSKYSSFQRQLHIWDFYQIGAKGKGVYFHKHFTRDGPLDVNRLRSIRINKMRHSRAVVELPHAKQQQELRAAFEPPLPALRRGRLENRKQEESGQQEEKAWDRGIMMTPTAASAAAESPSPADDHHHDEAPQQQKKKFPASSSVVVAAAAAAAPVADVSSSHAVVVVDGGGETTAKPANKRKFIHENSSSSNDHDHHHEKRVVPALTDHSVCSPWSDERFQELLAFRSIHGHCLVPCPYPLNLALGIWVSDQQASYKKNLLPENRIQMLEEAGFVWERPSEFWIEQFEALLAVRKYMNLGAGKITRLPPSCSSELETFIATEREKYQLDTLSEEKILLLEDVAGLELDPEGTCWEKRYRELLVFKAQLFDHLSPDETCTITPSLAKWLQEQRVLHQTQCLSDARFRLLDDAGMIWEEEEEEVDEDEDESSSPAALLPASPAAVADSHEQQVPDVSVTSSSTNTDTTSTRKRHKRIDTEEETLESSTNTNTRSAIKRQKRADADEETLEEHDKFWMERWSELEEFHRNGGIANPITDYSRLAIWVEDQREEYRRFYNGKGIYCGRMTQEKIQALDSIGFQWK